jgi:hypothetical protein
MMSAYEEAAREANVPFVKIEGQHAKQTLKHFKVEGFPTILGIDSENRAFPFVSPRTKEELLSFASKLASKEPEANEIRPAEAPKEENIDVTATVTSVEVLDADAE